MLYRISDALVKGILSVNRAGWTLTWRATLTVGLFLIWLGYTEYNKKAEENHSLLVSIKSDLQYIKGNHVIDSITRVYDRERVEALAKRVTDIEPRVSGNEFSIAELYGFTGLKQIRDGYSKK